MNYNFYIYTKKPLKGFAILATIWAIRAEKRIKSMKNQIDILSKEVEMLKLDREE